MTSENTVAPEGLWADSTTCCTGRHPGWVRVRRNGSWRLTCVNSEIGQNGLRVAKMYEDPYAPVPGQLTIDDVTEAAAEDVAAAEYADQLAQAILAGVRPPAPPASVAQRAPKFLSLAVSELLSLRSPGVGIMPDGLAFRTFVPMQSSGCDTPTSGEKSIATCGTIAPSPVVCSPEEV